MNSRKKKSWEVILDIRSQEVKVGQVQKIRPNWRQGVIAIIGSTTCEDDKVEHSKQRLKSTKSLTGNLHELELPNQNICMH